MRWKRLILGGLFLLLFSIPAGAHVGRHMAVIVDTDTALDDIRALGLLLQSEDVDILAVVTSDGACAPGPGARNVRAVLRALGRAYIPVAPGRRLDLPSPAWRAMSESLGWSDLVTGWKSGEAVNRPEGTAEPDSSLELIQRVLRETTTDVTYLCLGPMTNLAAALLADSSVGERISVVYYSGSMPAAEPKSWNTARDVPAAEAVFESRLPVLSFQVTEEDLLTFDASLWTAVCDLQTPVAELLCRLHVHEDVQPLVRSGHFRCWDEMVVLGLLVPGICQDPPGSERSNDTRLTRMDRPAARLWYLSLLRGEANLETGHRKPVVLTQYPTDPKLLQEDIRPLVAAIIERHGLEEWNAALLANEFHRHLGIYSLVGVKMGIRAREVLGAGLDELQVVSLAGSGPPLSCLNDGLQVATGASLGRGSISVEPGKSEPAALFSKGTARLRLQLKVGITTMIQTDIREAVRTHGALTPAYWRSIRQLALHYWLEMSRRDIVDEVSQDQPISKEVRRDVVAP